jgi:hypothetical protein
VCRPRYEWARPGDMIHVDVKKLGRGMLRKVLFVAYIVIGVTAASGHHYFAHLNGAKQIVSALLAVVLWPLILFGVSLHIK